MSPDFLATEVKGNLNSSHLIIKRDEDDIICSVYEETESDKISNERGNLISQLRRNAANWLREVFLPKGYPNSVSEDYLEYQMWDSLQAYCSNLAGALSLHSTLVGIGVGEESASPLAAALSWLLKDGAGMVSSIAFAYYKGSELDNNSKQWRLFADVANDGAHLIKLVAPRLPLPFIASLCVSSVMSSLVGVAGGATRASLVQHQALADNMADVSAKDGSQETMVNLAGLLTSLTLLPSLTSSPIITWMTFILCVMFHLYSNYMAMRCLRMKTLNRGRLLCVFREYTTRAFIPDVGSANRSEPLLFGPAFVHDYLTSSFRLRGGVSLSFVFGEFGRRGDSGRRLFAEQFGAQKKTFNQRFYLIFLNSKSVFIVFHGSAREEHCLEAFWCAYLLALNLGATKSGISSEFKVNSFESTNASEMIVNVSILAQKTFREMAPRIQEVGWDLRPLRLNVDEWRVTPTESS